MNIDFSKIKEWWNISMIIGVLMGAGGLMFDYKEVSGIGFGLFIYGFFSLLSLEYFFMPHGNGYFSGRKPDRQSITYKIGLWIGGSISIIFSILFIIRIVLDILITYKEKLEVI